MRRGEVAKATTSLDDIVDVYRGFRYYGARMRRKAAHAHGSAVVKKVTKERLGALETMCVVSLTKVSGWVGAECVEECVCWCVCMGEVGVDVMSCREKKAWGL